MAMPDATPALMDRVEPNMAIEHTAAQASRAAADSPGPPGRTRARRPGQLRGLQRHRARQVVHPHQRQPRLAAHATRSSMAVVADVLVPLGDHGAPAVPAAPAHDVHAAAPKALALRTTVPMFRSWRQFSTATWKGKRRRSRSSTMASTRQ